MRFPEPDPELAADLLAGRGDVGGLFAEARRLRDEGHGRTVTYSRKVFVPLTTLCRDRCTYCTFARPPGAGGEYLSPEDVLAIVEAGRSARCTEALFTLGDRPEDRWSDARRFLDTHGCSSTLEYVARTGRLVLDATSLFPHVNAGVMSEPEMAMLRPVSASMGLMLENSSPRLLEPGMPHHGSPDKEPAARIATIRASGRLRVPFTTGILVGIGERIRELVESIFVLRDLVAETGSIQEVIVQNFRAKLDTPKRRDAEPTVQFFSRVVAATRWILGPSVHLQVPPNLTERFEVYLEAGIDDWGGVSPLTIDWVNPEAPWPHLNVLRARTEAAGFTLMPRLPVYPEYLDSEWIDPAVLSALTQAADDDGYALAPQEQGAP
jgi:FO synthase